MITQLSRVFALSCLGLGAPAMAATFHSDEASYLAATGAQTLVAVQDLGPSTPTPTYTVGDVSFTEVFPSFEAWFGTAGSTFSDASSLITGPEYWMSGSENFDVTTTAAFYGFSFVIHEFTTTTVVDGCATTCVESTFSIELLSGGTSLGSFLVEPVNDALTFVGLSSATPFDTVRVRETVGGIDNEMFGQFQFAAAAPVPLPAGLPLLLAGGAALVAVGRRRR